MRDERLIYERKFVRFPIYVMRLATGRGRRGREGKLRVRGREKRKEREEKGMEEKAGNRDRERAMKIRW